MFIHGTVCFHSGDGDNLFRDALYSKSRQHLKCIISYYSTYTSLKLNIDRLVLELQLLNKLIIKQISFEYIH